MNKERYNKIKFTKFIGEEGLLKLRNSRVLIFGAGGIGSNLLQNIAATGIGHIGLVDNDVVELKNLSVQILYNENSVGKYKVDECKKWVNQFDPSIDIKTWNIRLDENNWQDILKDYDIAMCAFDEVKSSNLVNRITVQENKPTIYGGVFNDYGNVWTTIPHKTPCNNCFIEQDDIKVPDNSGIIEPICSIITGLMTWEAVKLILNKGTLIALTHLEVFALHGMFKRPHIYKSKTEKCPVCGLPRLSFKPFQEICFG